MIIDEDVYLYHFGVKGMRWGVVKKEKLVGNVTKNTKIEDTKEYLDILKEKQKPVNKTEQVAALAENNKKFSDKFTSEESKKTDKKVKGWRPTPNQVAFGLIGSAFVGLIVYDAVKQKQFINTLPAPGTKIDVDSFLKATNISKTKAWLGADGKKYLTKESFRQQEFSIPAGHVFHRISDTAESTFGTRNYATASIEDFNRYLVAFRGEKSYVEELHHITFTAKDEIKVPSLTTTIETMREVLNERTIPRGNVSKKEAMNMYTSMTGGTWGGATATGLFEKLSKQGFSAFIDHMDAGVIGDKPLVVFNPKMFSEKVDQVIRDTDVKSAEQNLLELVGRRL